MVLNAIFEGDFLGFSYGFRTGVGPHTLDARWCKNAEGELYLDAESELLRLCQPGLARQIVEHRVGDKRIVRLIRKW